MSDANTKAIQLILGEPVFPEFSDSTRKTRTTLLLVSAVTVALTYGGLTINSSSTILGLQLEGLDQMFALKILLALTTYFCTTFCWSAWDTLKEWRIRLTGSKIAFKSGSTWGSAEQDSVANPRNSSLNNWWRQAIGQIDTLYDPVVLRELSDGIEAIQAQIGEYQGDAEAEVLRLATNATNSLSERIQRLANGLNSLSETLRSERIPASLARFDNAFRLFLRSQSMRWLLIEVLVPLALASSAIYLAWCEIFTQVTPPSL